VPLFHRVGGGPTTKADERGRGAAAIAALSPLFALAAPHRRVTHIFLAVPGYSSIPPPPPPPDDCCGGFEFPSCRMS